MKKIGVLLSSPREVGGIYQYSLSVIEALELLSKKKKFHIKYYYTDKIWEKELPTKIKKKLIYKSLFKKILRKVVYSIAPKKLQYFFLQEFLHEEVKIINESDCDLIIFPSQNITSYQVKKKTLSTIHDLMHIYESKFSEYTREIIKQRNLHYKRICKFCDGILVDSSMGKKHVEECYNVESKKLYILPFIAPRYLNKIKKINIFKKFNLNKKYLFYPAQFWEHKNHINLIKGFKYVLKKNPNVMLVFCGSKKNYYKEVLNYVFKNKLEKKIIFLGRVSDDLMSSLYTNSVGTIYASLCGPTNIPPLESISLGTPLACSNAYSMKKQMGNSAIYFNPKDYKSISRKINLLLNSKKLRKKLVTNGKKKIAKYNILHFSNLLEKHINKILI
ncbi:glycosyltransferase family 4 protein [Candidatus Pelagibacter sp. HIMB1748]|uniref:glycosyltransferase family 4 protein n=1 Tax=unclassified Candidatus Pelagibacter TaxID=2647897 RepID=UPI003F832F15